MQPTTTPLDPDTLLIPDEATGFRHVGDAANAVLDGINATQPVNVVKMHDAIDRWVREAKALPNGVALMQSKVAWLEQQSAILSGPGDAPPYLLGVDAWEISIAIGRAVRAIEILAAEQALCTPVSA